MLKLKATHLVRPSLRRLLFVGPFAIAMLNYACSKAATSDTVAAPGATPTPAASNSVTTSSGVNALASAYPGGLSLSLFPTDGGTSLRLDTPADEVAGAQESLKAKKEAAEKILNGKGDDCLPEVMKKAPPAESSETCYEFDQDMVYGYMSADKKLGTKNGLNASGEACLVAFSRSKVDQVADMVDRSTGMVQAMFCQAKKADNEIALPEKGKSLDLLASLTKAFGSKANKVGKASIKRLDDTEDGLALYESTVEMETGDGKSRVVTLIHSPGADGDYRGIMLTSVEAPANNVDKDMIHYASIRYSRVTADSKTMLNYELRSARINKIYETVFGEDGQLDFNAGADFTAPSTSSVAYGKHKKADGSFYEDPNKAMSSATYITASVDSDTGAGTVLYAQNPGGNYNESARGMVANLALDEADGVMKGCATSGAALGTSVNPFADGMSIRRSLKEDASLAPRGFFHPFLNTATGNGPNSCSSITSGSDADGSYKQKTCNQPNPQGGGNSSQVSKWYVPAITGNLATTFVTDQNGPLITRQCFKLSDSKYVIDTDEISSEAGYELVKTDDTASAGKLIAPPNVGAVLDDKAPIGPPLDSIPAPAKVD